MKTPEFDPELLLTIAPEKREDFKRLVRKKRYLSSGLFLFIWHANLWALCFPVVFLSLALFQWDKSLEPLFGIYSAGIFSFFLAIILGYSTRTIRASLNQTGLHVLHFLFIMMPVAYGCWWWLWHSPGRGY